MGDVINVAEWASLRRWLHSDQKIAQIVVVNWLDLELGHDLHWWEERRLNLLHGWRNREVYGYIERTIYKRESDLTLTMYGSNEPIRNIHWSREHGYY
jgi:hypothetical protein